MKCSHISKLADELKNKYQTANPMEICENLGICLLFQPMGTHENAIKGFVIGVDGVFTVTVNSDLPENIQRVIVAHELCHALKHCSDRVTSFSDSALFDETSEMEKEANIFAAELLIDDNDILSLCDENVGFFELASQLLVPAELLEFKFRIMKQRGINIPEPPLNSHNNFLRSIKIKNG